MAEPSLSSLLSDLSSVAVKPRYGTLNASVGDPLIGASGRIGLHQHQGEDYVGYRQRANQIYVAGRR